jgi:hypothetical protein
MHSTAPWNWNPQNAPAFNFVNPWPQYQGPTFTPQDQMMAQMAQMALQNQANLDAGMHNANGGGLPMGHGFGVYDHVPSTEAEKASLGFERPVQKSKKGKATKGEDMATKGKDKAKAKIIPLPVPKPTAEYDLMSQDTPIPVFPPQRLLVIIDLNGTLLHRKNSKATFEARKNVGPFLQHLLQHHSVMIWSSSKPDNVSKMVGQLFTDTDRSKLVAEWARDTLDLSPAQYAHKVQVYKQLSWVWAKKAKRAVQPHPLARDGVRWGQGNTVLLDDSALKAVAEPHNLVELPEFEGGDEAGDVLGRVLAYIEWIRGFHDVSAAIRARKFDAADGQWAWTWETSGQDGMNSALA